MQTIGFRVSFMVVAIILGCEKAPQRSNDRSIEMRPANLERSIDRLKEPFRFQIRMPGGFSTRNIKTVCVVRNLIDDSRRVCTPLAQDNDIWSADLGEFSEVNYLELWSYHDTLGLAMFRLTIEHLQSSVDFMRFDLKPQEKQLVVNCLDEEERPVSGLRIGVNRMYPNNSSSGASEVPTQVWEWCREVTDESGRATLRLSNGVSAISLKAENALFGSQTFEGISQSELHVVHLKKAGKVHLNINKSAASLSAFEVALVTSDSKAGFGFFRRDFFEAGMHELKLAAGEVRISIKSENDQDVVVVKSDEPLEVIAGKDLEIELEVIHGCRIRGRLVTETNGGIQPIPQAGLSIHSEDNAYKLRKVVTDDSGVFSTRMPVGSFQLSSAVVYLGKHMLQLEKEISGSVKADQTVCDLGDIRLPPLFEVEGGILKKDGTPVQFSEVTGSQNGLVMGGGVSNEKGEFVILSQSPKVDEFDVWTFGEGVRYGARILQYRPLKLRIED